MLRYKKSQDFEKSQSKWDVKIEVKFGSPR